MEKTFVRVLGSTNWLQTKMNDHSSYTLSDTILIDVCPGVIHHLLEMDVDPLKLKTVCFTHMHADHYMGLAPLLLYFRAATGRYDALTLIGPKKTVKESVLRALHFNTHDAPGDRADVCGMPTIIELDDGEGCSLHPDFEIESHPSDHAVPGVVYRFTHRETGRNVCFTGDTRYVPSFADWFKNTDLLVHEASSGAKPVGPNNEISRHSSVFDAIRVTRESGAKKLMITHINDSLRKDAIEIANAELGDRAFLAEPYKVFEC
ncbi:MAG: MBL fold metallo-hydrolase [Clostridia bacterium]|nr:MBL fold metallo-hydrolase [Clostridia bacterium]